MSCLVESIEDVKLTFLLEVLPKIKKGKIVPNIGFIFSDETINSFYYLKNNKKVINDVIKIDRLINSIEILKKEKEEKNFDLMCTEVDDADLFFSYLKDLANSMYCQEIKYYGGASNDLSDIMLYIWLRMSPSDFNDVNKFLKLQYSFVINDVNTDDKVTGRWKYIDSYGKYQISYLKYLNDLWYESNVSMCMRLEDNGEFYVLPSIFYGITNEDGRDVCYIYGMQNNSNMTSNNSDKISNELKKLNKGRNNHGTFISFVIALEKFIMMLYDNGITIIKVPLLQVLNYDFHILLSDLEKENLIKNFPNKEELDKLIEQGIESDEVLEYKKYINGWYINAVDKEADIIKRKTEGLINIFRRLQDQTGIIRIESIPFIEDENLIVKISDEKRKEK